MRSYHLARLHPIQALEFTPVTRVPVEPTVVIVRPSHASIQLIITSDVISVVDTFDGLCSVRALRFEMCACVLKQILYWLY